MGGGSTTVEGPKKEGPSAAVVTGVLRSPGVGSGASSVGPWGPRVGGGLPPDSWTVNRG